MCAKHSAHLDLVGLEKAEREERSVFCNAQSCVHNTLVASTQRWLRPQYLDTTDLEQAEREKQAELVLNTYMCNGEQLRVAHATIRILGHEGVNIWTRRCNPHPRPTVDKRVCAQHIGECTTHQ